MLADALDGLRLLVPLRPLPRTGALEPVFVVPLLGGTLWLWPTLGRERGPAARPT